MEELRDIIFMLMLVVLPIIQIVMLVKGIKRKSLGFAVFAVGVLSIVIATSMLIYYESLPGYGLFPGLTYLIQVFACMIAMALYTLIMFITVCSKIIMFEKRRKSEGKSHANPLVLSLAFICFVGAAATFAYEKYENRDVISTVGTVTSFEDHDIAYYTNEERKDVTYNCPVITFAVEGKEYSDFVYPDTLEEETALGDTVEIYCRPSYSGGYYISVPDDAKLVYLPALALCCILLVYRLIKSGKKPKNANTAAAEHENDDIPPKDIE